MAEIKTKANAAKPEDFLNTIEPAEKRADSYTLLELFKKVTGEDAVMWGSSIIGFGKYHYKSERSRQEADWMLTAFSPRKQNLTLYIMAGNTENTDLLAKLGKHKTSAGCLYINKLADVDMKVLEELIRTSYTYMKKTHS